MLNVIKKSIDKDKFDLLSIESKYIFNELSDIKQKYINIDYNALKSNEFVSELEIELESEDSINSIKNNINKKNITLSKLDEYYISLSDSLEYLKVNGENIDFVLKSNINIDSSTHIDAFQLKINIEELLDKIHDYMFKIEDITDLILSFSIDTDEDKDKDK
ncbi:MAG: hypothetical protein GQ557_01895 [Mycoplasmataceae bacterium]|nr:hypothetical protein [Mycoplasmataceae bacterium]